MEQDEVVILREENVSASYTAGVTLILTNKAIIQEDHILRSGQVKTYRYPFDALKSNKGIPNVLLGKKSDGQPRLELYLKDYDCFFSFSKKSSAKKWQTAIVKAYKEYMADLERERRKEKRESKKNVLFKPVMDAFSDYKKAAASKSAELRKRINKCPRCGAVLDGKSGETVRCIYCETTVVLK